jgi:hypothetical protein
MKYLAQHNKMMILAHRVLQYLGATEVVNVTGNDDPITEEDFLKLEYTAPEPITWQMYTEAYPLVENLVGMKLLRLERTRQLAKTDWVMTVDSFQTLSNKDEWLAYRQALRDLPANPPPFKWKGTDLDIEAMFPVQPPILRNTPN